MSSNQRSSGQKRWKIRFKPDQTGRYVDALHVVAGDDVVRASFSCYVHNRPSPVPPASPAAVARALKHRDKLEIFAASCDAGKDLLVDIKFDNTANRPGTVLVFCENTAMLAWRALELKPGRHVVRFPTSLDYAPQVHVSAIAFFSNNQSMTDSSTARITPVQRFLNLQVVAEKQAYRPGERCNVKVKATNWRNQPVPHAEISLGVVDRAVYWLREDPTPDLSTYFHRYDLPKLPVGAWNQTVSLAPEYFWKGPKKAWGFFLTGLYGGRSNAGRLRAVGKYGGCSRAGRKRVDFRSEAFWVADLLTDRNGEAQASFIFPDSITQWRFTARGVTADNLVGNVQIKTETALPLHVDLVAPRALRVGDDIQIQSLVWNRKGVEKHVRTSFQVGAGDLQAGSLTVPAESSKQMTVAICAKRLGDIPIELSVKDTNSELRDRVRKTVPVLPRGYRVNRRFCGRVTGDQEIPLDLGNAVLPGTMTLTFQLESGPTAAVQSALNDLIDYPYGCVEQTMSRFLPAVVASEAMRRSDLTCARAKELPEIIEKGMKRLLNFQHEDGGWGWWKTDRSNVFMTAYVLAGLSLCRQTGCKVPDRLLHNAEIWLERQFYNEKKSRSHRPHSLAQVDLRIYTAHALATRYSRNLKAHEDQVERLLDNIPDGRANGKALPARDAILRADTLRLLGQREQANRALAKIMKTFPGPKSDRASLLAAANLIEVGMGLQPADGRWIQFAQQLLQQRRGSGWGNTLLTASVVRGLTPLIGSSKKRTPVVELRVAGKTVSTLKGKTGVVDGCILKQELTGKAVTLHTVEPGGFWSATLEGYVAKLPQPKDPEVVLTLIPKHIGNGSLVMPVDEKGTLTAHKGETIELELSCLLKRDITYTRLTIPRPCGVQFLSSPPLRNGIVAVEQRDDAYHIFIDSWKKGTHTVKLRVRSEVTGTVFAPAPELVPMYDKAPPVLVNAPRQWLIKSAHD